MNYSKWILFSGIVLLSGGAAARVTGSAAAPFLFSAGGACKLSYIIMAIKTGRYRPGYEILFLASGLAILACGIISRHYPSVSDYSLPVISFAVSLKVIFVVLFIKKVRE
ncbi:MAG TPA: hypothetical protein PK358_15180 [Spirochaetota bacterium]|nr:hypothetical protein [Spirochaetota bacterium]